jgi:DNA primase
MQRERKLIALRRALDQQGHQKGEEIVFFCPKHGHRTDRKYGQLGVNLESDNFNCFVCGWKGRDILPLLRLKGDTADSREYAEEIRPDAEKPKKEYDDVRLPREFRPLAREYRSPWYRMAANYLASRGLDERDILVYKLGYCEDGDYRNRIIVPSFDSRGELNFFVGRSFLSDTMKYKHGVFCKDIIFNDYLIDWDSPVTLVEGVFDAMRIGGNSIPLLGVFLNPESQLFKKIVERQKLVYVALDADAKDKQFKIMRSLNEHGVAVGCVNVASSGFKDPGEMPREKFETIKLNSMIVSSAVDMLKMKVAESR